MAILVTNDTKLCVSGITGREGTFHTLNNKNYGTNVVSGVTPGKGGQDVEGIPVFNTFHARRSHAHTSPVTAAMTITAISRWVTPESTESVRKSPLNQMPNTFSPFSPPSSRAVFAAAP